MTAKIFIIDLNQKLAAALTSALNKNSYIAEYSSDINSALEAAIVFDPLVLLISESAFFATPGKISIASSLSTDPRFKHIASIVMLDQTNNERIENIINYNAFDYIVKCNGAAEIFSRLRLNVQRIQRQEHVNPLTKLPGNISITNEMNRRIANGETFAVCHADLSKFKAYNDIYGFKAGDDIIKFTAAIIAKSLHESGAENSFLGHIGGDDFLFIVKPSDIDTACTLVIKNFDKGVKDFYNPEDLKRGYIISYDRKGNVQKFPLSTIYISAVSNEHTKIERVEQIGAIDAELRAYAKSFDYSIYIKDRRIKPI